MKAPCVYIVKQGNMVGLLVFVYCLWFRIDGDRSTPTMRQMTLHSNQRPVSIKPSNNNNIASDDEIINNDDGDEDGVDKEKKVPLFLVSYQQSKGPGMSKTKQRNP